MMNFNNIMAKYKQFRQNPMQMLSQRFKIPNNVNMNNPDEIIQHLLNSGQVSQSQYDQIRQMAKQFQG